MAYNLTKKQKENCKHNSKKSSSGKVFPVNDSRIILWDFNMRYLLSFTAIAVHEKT